MYKSYFTEGASRQKFEACRYLLFRESVKQTATTECYPPNASFDLLRILVLEMNNG